jgi:hypothetical protein
MGYAYPKTSKRELHGYLIIEYKREDIECSAELSNEVR